MAGHPDLHRLAQAAADNDAVAEERDVEQALADIGLAVADVAHVAEQRALRAVVLERPGGAAELARIHAAGATERPAGFALTGEERRRLVLYAGHYMDGIAIGTRAERARGFKTYTELRDFLDGYTNDAGVIQGDPATVAAEAAEAGRVAKDEQFRIQNEDA